jgi:hypothetical protein
VAKRTRVCAKRHDSSHHGSHASYGKHASSSHASGSHVAYPTVLKPVHKAPGYPVPVVHKSSHENSVKPPVEVYRRKKREVAYGSASDATEENSQLDSIFEDHSAGHHSGSHHSGEDSLPYGCDGESYQIKPCHESPCAVDGCWSKWSEWSLCSVTCGDGGMSLRNRSCTEPVPANGGKVCFGVYTEHRLCSVSRECPIDGGWSSWCGWSPCSISCGAGGNTIRDRVCNSPTPANGGEPCDGDSKEIRGCCKNPCPIDGSWGAWTAWSNPTLTCGLGGMVNRTRYCDNPTPAFGGQGCEGTGYGMNTVHLPPCPVNGNWAGWTSWSECSVTCGSGGFEVRSRSCDHPSPLYGGKFCIGDSLVAKPCSRPACEIPGGWSNWFGWSPCSETCGFGGRMHRKRICDHPKPAHGGPQCVGNDEDSKFCFIQQCEVNGKWSPWSEWSFNSATCGEGGAKTRTRECSNPEPAYGGKKCLGDESDTVPVDLPDCQINGGWSGWGEWSESSVTCGDGGIQIRKRQCDNPRPTHGGLNCHGPDFETRTVDLVPCAVCGGWTAWSDWSDCSKTCGSGGLTSRTRECTNPTPTYGGYPCVGEPAQTKGCTALPCAVNGAWSGWSEWSLCSATCGDSGFTQRIRHCDNPEPGYNGLPCEGLATDQKSCQATSCPINGKWSVWGPWSPPSATCGHGAMSARTRACTSPEPQFGGHFCPNSFVEVKNITTKPCAIDAGWTQWSPWTACSVTCGLGGTNTRSRDCCNPRAQYGGKNCRGDAKEARFCASAPCAVNGNWGPWTEFSKCSVTCGDGGITTRMRACDHPAPAYGGVYCTGPSSETVDCKESPCPVNGGWGPWSHWSQPTTTCSFHGFVKRMRNCDSPTPGYGGEPCEGESSETKLAPIVPCPIPGGWTSWTGWSICSHTCGEGGVTKRHRYCENP